MDKVKIDELVLHNVILEDDIYEESIRLSNLSDREFLIIEEKALKFLEKILTLSTSSEEFDDYKRAIHHLADKASRANFRATTHFLDRPAMITSINNFTNINPVSNNISKLREIFEKLDPKNIDENEEKKIFGFISVKWGLKDYFAKYEKSKFDIKRILDILSNSHIDIDKDNVSLEVEKEHIIEHIIRLEKYIRFIKKLQELLKKELPAIREKDSDKAYVFEREFLERILEKKKGFLKRQSMNIHGYKVFEYIKQNNNQLIKGIDRVTENISHTLKSAVFLSEKLTKQKINLNELNKNRYIHFAVNKNSCDISEYQKQIAVTSLEELEVKFKSIYQSIESVNDFKAKALLDINNSIDFLKSEIEKLKNDVKIESFTPNIKNPIIL